MMSKEKQIEGLAEAVRIGKHAMCDVCSPNGRDCEECETDRLVNAIYNAGYRKQIEGEWISIEERLPESLQRVLAIDTEGDMFTAVYVSFATGRNAWSTSFRHLGSITHWMPLPEPPKGDAS